jgi:ATP-dependent DNA helicase RecG
MEIREITNREVHKIASAMESHVFDFKSKLSNGETIQKAVVAFANADGGEILIGLEDKKTRTEIENRWNGFVNIEEANDIIHSIISLTPKINCRYEFLFNKSYSGFLLRVFIEKANSVAITSKQIVYQRMGAQSLKITDPQRIQALNYSKGTHSYEETILSNIQPDLIDESDAMKFFIKDQNYGG